MYKTISRKYFHFIVICSVLIGIQAVLANDSFQNNLLKTDINKNTIGGVKVTLYTSKPYKDSIVTNKKNDYEYVILMPETANSLTTKPAFNSASDVIKNVEVKTQQYVGGVKGYTKITIATTKPIEIVPQVQTLNSSNYALNDRDYKELLAQTAKKQLKPVVKKEAKSTSTTQVIKNTKSSLVQAKKEKTPSVSKIIRKLNQTDKETVSRKIYKKNNYKIEKISRASKFKEKKYNKVSTTPNASQKIKLEKPVTEIPQKRNVVKPIQSKDLTAPRVEKPSNALSQTTTKPSTTLPVQKVETPSVQVPTTTSKIVQIENILITYIPGLTEVRLHKFKSILKNNLYTALAVAAIIFIMLLLVARKMTKSMNRQRKDFVENLEAKPFEAEDLSEKITEDMTWKEKFQTYVDATSNIDQEEDIEIKPIQRNEDLDELFSSEATQEVESVQSQESILTEYPIQDELPSAQEEIQKESPEQIGLNQQEQDLEPADIEQERQLSDMDKMWGDESLSFEDEDVSLDELFREEEFAKPEIQTMYTPVSDIDEISIEEEPKLDDIDEIYEQQIVASQILPGAEYYQEKEEAENEIVKSEYIIDDGKGFYLVDFEDSTALVGQIGDEIFVLKRFDKKVDEKLQARLNEKKGNSVNYMTKVGDFKAIVEVSSNNMNLLIEL